MLSMMVVLLLAGAQASPAPRAALPEDEVRAQTRRYFEAVRQNDAAALDGLLTPDYVEVSPLGQVDRRAQVVEFYRIAARAQTGQASEVTEVVIDDLSVRVYGDVAVAVAGESFKLTVAGKPVARPMRSTLVWRRVGGSWALASSHHTAIRPPLPPAGSVER